EETFLLCIDEFDEILRKIPTPEASKVQGLVLHITEWTNLALKFFFTITRLPEAIRDAASSPLIGKSEPIRLHPFNAYETSEMVQGLLPDRAIISTSGMDWLLHMSGGHPYFVKLLLANLLERRSPGETALEVTDALLEQALYDSL